MITIDDIRSIALSLPETFERASYGGRPSWRTSQRMFAWVREDPEALVVWVESLEEKDALLAADPGVFTTTSHYDGEPIVLVDLDRIDLDHATELIIDSWRNRAPGRLVRSWDAGQDVSDS